MELILPSYVSVAYVDAVLNANGGEGKGPG